MNIELMNSLMCLDQTRRETTEIFPTFAKEMSQQKSDFGKIANEFNRTQGQHQKMNAEIEQRNAESRQLLNSLDSILDKIKR